MRTLRTFALLLLSDLRAGAEAEAEAPALRAGAEAEAEAPVFRSGRALDVLLLSDLRAGAEAEAPSSFLTSCTQSTISE